jgi:hypothetical protein
MENIMPIDFSTLGGTNGSGKAWWEVNSTVVRTSATYEPGLYLVTAEQKNQSATPVNDALTFFDESESTIYETTLVGLNSNNTLEPAERFFFLPTAASRIQIGSTLQNIYFSLEKITTELETSETFTLTYYTTSQDVTLDGTEVGFILLGAGGGSFPQGWGGANGSGGGGSGYAVVNLEPVAGTYPLVIGAGGISSNGGASTFAGLTANGGVAGVQGGQGGSGGSGGGTGAAQGGYGGTNGENGGGSNPGIGSGVSLPYWSPGMARVTQNLAGGFYTGGGGGNFGTGGQTALEGTGGGAGGKNQGGPGHAGGSGVLIVGEWV